MLCGAHEPFGSHREAVLAVKFTGHTTTGGNGICTVFRVELKGAPHYFKILKKVWRGHLAGRTIDHGNTNVVRCRKYLPRCLLAHRICHYDRVNGVAG